MQSVWLVSKFPTSRSLVDLHATYKNDRFETKLLNFRGITLAVNTINFVYIAITF